MRDGNIIGLIDELEELLETAVKVPMTGKGLVDCNYALDIVDQLRAKLPEEIRQAQRLVAQKEEFLASARKEAEAILKASKENAAKMLSESEIMKAAEEEAKRLFDMSRKTANDIRKGAEDYAYNVLVALQSSLERALQTIENGKNRLKAITPSEADAKTEVSRDDQS